MARTKLHRFDVIQQHTKVIDSWHPLRVSIKWHRRSDFFHNQNPITLELACGYGEYTFWLASRHPQVNYVGVDIKGERFYHGLMQAENQWLTNVWFARIIIQNLEQLFAPWEVDDIWIVHPDPRPKWVDEHRRLTYSRFLDIYYRLLSDGWLLRLKTDDYDLWDYSVASIMEDGRWELIDSTTDLHTSPLLVDHYDISTRYERRGIERGRTICYGVWRKIYSKSTT